MITLQLLLPLFAAMLYAIAALFLNAAGRAGVGGFLSTACCNVFLALWFMGFYDWSAFPAVATPFWPVILLAVFLVLGQGFTILALSLGEVSIIAPVMGLKVILVNIIVAVGLRESLAPRVWVAAALSVAGIICLQYNPGKHLRPPHSISSMVCAFISALFFAAMDVHIQHWSPRLGFDRFIPPAMLLGALLSLLFLLPNGGGVRNLSYTARKSLIPGGLLLSLQSLMLIFAIVRYGNAAQANIVYSSRGVWSVVFVWLLGHYFANLELKNRPQGRVFSRLTGAVLITLAIILAIDRP